MRVPQQPQTTTCLCNNYHTTFTSQRFKYPEVSRPSTPTESTPLQPISNLSRKLFNKSNLLPQSLIKLNLQLTPTLLFPSATFISADNVDLSTAQIAAHTHYSYTCAICQKQNITCAVLLDSKHLHDSSAIIIKERLIHKSCFKKMKISIKQTQQPYLQTKTYIWYYQVYY